MKTRTRTRNRTRHLLAAATVAAGFTIALSAGSAAAGIDPVDEISDVEVVCNAADPATVQATYDVSFETYELVFRIEFADGTPQPCGSEFYGWSQWPIIPAHEKTKSAADVWAEWTQQGYGTLTLPIYCQGFGGLYLDDVKLLSVPEHPCPADDAPDDADDGDNDGGNDDGNGEDDGESGGQPGSGLPETGSTSLSLVLAAAVATSLGLGVRRIARRPA